MKIDISKIWKNISENGITNSLIDSEKIRIRMLNRIIFINAVLALVFIAVDLSNYSFEGALISLIAFLISPFIFVLIKNKFYQFAKWTIVLFVVIYISSIAIITGKNAGMIIYFIPGVLFPIIIFQNKKVVLGLSILIVLVLIGVFSINQIYNPQIIISEKELNFYNISSLIGCTSITFLILWHFKNTITPKPNHFTIKEQGIDVKISSDNVFFVKSDGNYIEIYTSNKRHIIRCKIGDFLSLVPDENEYLRVSRSCVVRIDKIEAKGLKTIQINEHQIAIGRTYQSDVDQLPF